MMSQDWRTIMDCIRKYSSFQVDLGHHVKKDRLQCSWSKFGVEFWRIILGGKSTGILVGLWNHFFEAISAHFEVKYTTYLEPNVGNLSFLGWGLTCQIQNLSQVWLTQNMNSFPKCWLRFAIDSKDSWEKRGYCWWKKSQTTTWDV